jgi:hypothetical protein
MNKTKLNYAIDIGLAIALLGSVITGLVKFPGLLRSFGINYTNLPLGNISKIHDWSGIALAALVLLHLILHWNQIVYFTKEFFRGEK